MAATINYQLFCYVMKRICLTQATLLGAVISFLISSQVPGYSQVFTYCPGAKFYRYPRNVNPVKPQVPSGGIHMVSASSARVILDRDPQRVYGWTEVFVEGARGVDPKGPYWMTDKDFSCGEFVGR